MLEAPALPTAPPHPCGNRRCRGLAPRGERFCPSCKPEQELARHREDAERRGTAHERNYGTAWQAIRDAVLERDHHLCLYCQNVGLLTQAHEVDHVLPRSCGGTDDPANLASACSDCHKEKTVKHDGGWGRTLNPIRSVEQFIPEWPKRIGLVAA